MKITIQKAEKQKPESKYPYFGIHKENNRVVLFFSHERGIIIYQGSDTVKVTGTMQSFSEQEFYKPFNGTIKIEQ